MRESLIPFFEPRGVAIIGASQNPTKLSNGIVQNMLSYGYQGEIYAVNPKADQILGLKCYPSVLDIKEPVDLAVIILPSKFIASVVKDCGEKGIKAVTVISGGFKEVGEVGNEREKELLKILTQYDIRMIGPNCVGTMNLVTGMNTTFIRGVPAKGGIGFISQSGAVCGGVVDHIANKGIGFSHFLSLGNMADVSETDMIEYLEKDKDTNVIAVYMEGVQDGKRFVDVCRNVTTGKPVVVLKAGRSAEGAKAVSSHTGSLAGSHAAYQAAFEQSGVIEVFSVTDLLNTSMSLDWLNTPSSNRAVIVTNSGGPAALASDSFSEYKIQLSELSDLTQETLSKNLNPAAQVANPVDMLGGANEKEYAHALESALGDDGVDMALAILVPTSLVDPVKIAQAIIDISRKNDKPILTCLMGFEGVQDATALLHKNHLPVIDFPTKAGVIFNALLEHGKNKNRKEKFQHISSRTNNNRVDKIFSSYPTIKNWGEHLTREILSAYDIPLVDGNLAVSVDEAIKIANKISYPVVLKGASQDVLHKSDAGAVVINIKDDNSLKTAFEKVDHRIRTANPKARLDGMLIEKMSPEGKEVIIGMKRDRSFGPLIMFGMGGVFVELFEDVTFRVAPLSKEDVQAMIRETKAYKLLSGWRGETECDIEAIEETLIKLSHLAIDYPQIREIEINPLRVFAKGQGALALDCRMILD